MIKIDYPSYQPKIKKEQDKEFIFDEVRKQWIMLTPEEWVRQNFLQYLIQIKKYPASLIAVEKELKLGELKKRTDVIVYNTDAQPWLMIECKAMGEPVNEKVLQQILRYHISIPVPFIIITNGSFCFGFEKVNGDFVEIFELPAFV
ncbi:MAG TPA: type I restriction enzyme HsdR N-terminal domain-containing protein [Ferruginibacter sp.]|jgi:hypothetical protein|nr:type I restriction enzyme HsdR N-terminal domain-containing protein [Ferruginibacter sp.]